MFYKKNPFLKLRPIVFFVFSLSSAQAQLIQNVVVEIVGRPSWQILIPMKNNGIMLFAKTDMTKAKVFLFDANLVKKWEADMFLDVERQPTAYTFDENKATFLFREAQGMYYQIFIFDIKTGKFESKGFELREYFEDQDYVFLDNKLLMAGFNLKGGAFYEYDFETEIGKILESGIDGKVSCQSFKLNKYTGVIASVWAVKTLGYSNEKKKKGEYIKDSFLTIANFNKNGGLISKSNITQKAGNFPLSGKILKLSDDKQVVAGTYQSNMGEKGLFIATQNKSTSEFSSKFYPFSTFLNGQPPFTNLEISAISQKYNFLIHEPLLKDGRITIGGVFFKTDYQKITEPVNDPNDKTSNQTNSSVFGRSNSRTQTRNVFRGYNYLSGIVANFDIDGNLQKSNRVDINQLSPQLQQTLGFNSSGSVAYCLKGSLAAKNFNIGNKPVIYKLTDDDITAKNQSYLPYYHEVRHWYDNYFIADGSKSKIEVAQISVPVDTKRTTKRKMKKSTPTFTQIRKTIYLTKIASGT